MAPKQTATQSQARGRSRCLTVGAQRLALQDGGSQRDRMGSALKHLKTIIEIVAIAAAGGWVLLEYGLKERERRLQAEHVPRATIAIENKVTLLDAKRAWVHSRLKIRNPSKRVVRTLMTNWWFRYPPADAGPQISSVHNDDTAIELTPGEESELDHTQLVQRERRAIVVHAEVFLSQDDAGECVFAEPIPAAGIGQMHDQPQVCRKEARSKKCTAACSAQTVEALVELPNSTTGGANEDTAP